jgi:hypothetical protein
MFKGRMVAIAGLLVLLGSAAGTVLGLAVAHSMDLLVRDRSGAAQAMSTIIASAAERTSGDLDFTNVSRLATFGSPKVVQQYRKYRQACSEITVRGHDDCQVLWASLIQSMRADLDNGWLGKKDIIAALWGPRNKTDEGS